jgi:hypothetical protein
MLKQNSAFGILGSVKQPCPQPPLDRGGADNRLLFDKYNSSSILFPLFKIHYPYEENE